MRDKKGMNKLNNARPRGAPKKEKDKKISSNGLRPDQNKWLQDEGDIRGLSAAIIHREAVDWYITAKETKRADVTASQQFDKSYEGGDAKEHLKNE